MRKINRQDAIKILLILTFVAGAGFSMASVGRFSPTHAIVEPVYCGSCHPDQVVELNATTHLPHFAGAIYEEAEAINAGGSATITQAEAVSGGCMMCHNTWVNREKVFLSGYEIVDNVGGSGNYQLKINDILTTSTSKSTLYDVPVTANVSNQYIRLGTNVTVSTSGVTVQDPGTSGLAAGSRLVKNTDWSANGTTGIDFVAGSANVSALFTGEGTVKIEYTVNNGAVKSLKEMWGDLSSRSPTAGVFFNDVSGSNTCGNSEKGFCHAVETIAGKNIMNLMSENNLSVRGSGTYFQHEMAYTTTEYAAKQVKLCAVCHFNKLPAMTADGEPIRVDLDTQKVVRYSHGTKILDTNITAISSDWAHKQVQCIRCHSHAGIGPTDGLTGVRSN